MRHLGGFILWDYKRGSWQYDVMVGLILMFIFLTPRDVFRDQPKEPNVAMLNGGYWIEPQKLAGTPADQLVRKATQIVNQRYKTRATISSVEPIFDEGDKEIKGYMAFTK